MAESKRVKRKYLIDITQSIPKQSKRDWLRHEFLPFASSDTAQELSIDRPTTTSPFESFDTETCTDTHCVSNIGSEQDDVEPVSSDNESVSDFGSDNVGYSNDEVGQLAFSRVKPKNLPKCQVG